MLYNERRSYFPRKRNYESTTQKLRQKYKYTLNNVNDNDLLTLFRLCKVLQELWPHSGDFSVIFQLKHHHAVAVLVCNVICIVASGPRRPTTATQRGKQKVKMTRSKYYKYENCSSGESEWLS